MRVHARVHPVKADDDGGKVAPRGRVRGVLQEPDLVGVALAVDRRGRVEVMMMSFIS